MFSSKARSRASFSACSSISGGSAVAVAIRGQAAPMGWDVSESGWFGNKNHRSPWQKREQTATPANVCRRDQGSADHDGKEKKLALHGITGSNSSGGPGTSCRHRRGCRRKRLAGSDQGMTHPLVSAEGGVRRTRSHGLRSSTSVLVRMYYSVNPGALRNNHGIHRPSAGDATGRRHRQPLEPDRSSAGQD